jgi:hypothetical protein
LKFRKSLNKNKKKFVLDKLTVGKLVSNFSVIERESKDNIKMEVNLLKPSGFFTYHRV